MDLNEARKRLPELAGLSDESALNVIHQVYYPNMDRAALADRLGFKAAPPPVPERSMARAAGDLGLQFAGGAVSGVRMMSDLFGANNAVSGGLRGAEDALRELQSAAAKGDQQEISRILKEAEGKGVLDQVIAGAKAFGQAPGALIANALGTSVPTLATALIPGVGQGAMAARLAAGAGIGAAQGAGNTKSAIYEEVKNNPLPGETPEQTEFRAVRAQEYGGQNTGQIALGGVLGAAAGSTGMERALSGLRNGVTQAAPGMVARVGMGAAAEAVPEIAQGGQEKLAGNLALRNEGFDVDPMAGVVAGATMEGLAGGLTGGVTAIPRPAVIGEREPVPVPVPPVEPPGPMTKAVNALGPRLTTTPAADLLGRNTDPLAGQMAADRLAAEDAAVTRQNFADRNGAMLAGGGLDGSRADPLANMLADARTSDANSFTNVQQAANRRPPMPASDAARILDEAKNRGMDLTAAPHPDGGFVVVPRQWVTPDVAAQAETEIADTLARMQQADAAPVERAERRRSEPVELSLNTDPVAGYIEDLRNTNTPAARAYVGEFDAGRVTRADVEQRMQADRGKTADERLAEAAAEGLRMNPKGDPFKTLMAANLAAKTTPGTVIEVPGGYAIRPQESTLANTAAQEVPEADAAPVQADEPAAAVSFTDAADEAGGTAVSGGDEQGAVQALSNVQDAPQAANDTAAETPAVEAPAPARGDGAAAAGVPDAGAGAGVRADGVKRFMGRYGDAMTITQADAKVKELEKEARDLRKQAAAAQTKFMETTARDGATRAATLARKLRDDIKDAVGAYPDARAEFEVLKSGAGDVQADGVKPAGQRQLSADEQAAQDREAARAKEPSLPPVLSARLQEAHKAHGRDVKRSVVERSIANEKANNTGTPKARRERADRIARLEADLALFDEAADLSKNPQELNTSAEPAQKTAESEQVQAPQQDPDQQRRDFMAAEKKRADKRARLTRGEWEKNPLREFLGRHGVSMDLAKEFAPGTKERRKAIVAGHGPIFRKAGKNIDMLAEAAAEEGFTSGEDADALYELIGKVFRGERVAPLFADGVAESEMKARMRRAQEESAAGFDDFVSQQEEAGDPLASLMDDDYTLADIEGSGYAQASPELKAEVAALSAQLEAMGVDVESIVERVAQQTIDQTDQEYHEELKQVLQQAYAEQQAAQPGSLRNTGEDGRSQTGATESGAGQEGLTAPTKADIEAQQDRAEQAARDKAAADRAAERTAAQEEERKRIAKASEQAADTFELGGDAMANLTGQKDIFGAAEQQNPAPPKATKAAQEFTPADAQAAERQLAQMIGDRIDAMQAQAVQKIGAKFLPAMGIKAPIGKAKIKATVTDFTKVNPLAAASEFGVEMADSVRAPLLAQFEGRLVDAANPAAPAQQEAQQASEFGDIEKALQSKSHEAERQGDVAIVAGGGVVRYVSMDDAVQAVQAAIKSGVLAVPFQIHNATGIRLGDTDRVIKAAQEPATDDRDTFTLKRLNRETNKMEPVTFKRGEYIRHRIGDKDHFGEIDGISQARREFSVDGLWYPMGFANKAERPAAPVRKDMAPLSSVIDKVNAKNGEGLTDADRVPPNGWEYASGVRFVGAVEIEVVRLNSSGDGFEYREFGGAIIKRKSADEATKTKPAQTASKTPTVDRHESLMKSVREGKATAEQFKAAFESLVANKDAVIAELETKTKAELLKAGGYFIQMRYASEKKGEVIDAIYRQMVGNFVLGETLSYGMGKGAFEAAVRRHVEATDDAKLEQYAKDRQAAIAEAQAERAAKAAAMDNPQTLADFKAIIAKHIGEGKSAKEAFLSLTPEQRIQFDTLAAESTREAREARKRERKTEVRAAGQTTGGEIIATKHTRDGYDLFVVKLADRLSREDYTTVLASAKKLGGWYSAFRGNGAIPGFQFKDKANAEAFLKLAGGDTTDAQTQAEQRRDAFEDDRSETAVERLRTMADKLTEQAAEIESADRKTNTARRARFAASALNGAAEMKAKASTMRNIAQAIEAGGAKFLDAVRTKSQIDLLTGIVATAKNNELREKYPSYADQEKRRGEPATAETADFAEFPAFTAYRSDLATLGRQLLEVDGTKKLGQRLMSVADDVSDAYLEFAKQPANLFKLSTFSVKRGEEVRSAIFGNREQAETAIKRSGLTGKAIVLAEKRGVNRIIMSPSEAINAGIWTGDGDKRITLSTEFGNELVEAIGRRGNKSNKLTVPWQFQNAYDRRKALSRMGIETPSEYRSALREFIGLQERAIANKVREMELQMVGRKADGLDFFPTPAEVADQMIEAADITPDMAVLEPSAGMGHIADRIREAGAEPDVIEISPERRELLQEKGYHLAETDDFMAMQPRKFFTFGDVFRAPDGTEGVMQGSGGMGSRRVVLKPLIDGVEVDYKRGQWYDRDELVGVRHRGSWSGYDRIIMNPPFSNRRDAEHVMHAYTLLKPGGRIVAIMGEGVFFGQDKKAQEFRDWLESVNGTSEKLPAGSFMDPSLPVNTGVSARMVVIDKPAGDVKFSIDDSTGPADTADYGPATRIELTDGQRAAVARLQSVIRRKDGNAGYVLEPVEQVAGAGREFAFARDIIRDAFGIEVTPVKQPGKRIFNGAQVGDQLLLDVNTQKPAMAVMGHELLHQLRRDDPQLYSFLKIQMERVLKDGAADAYAKKLRARYEALGLDALNDDTSMEELLADIVGDQFGQRGFWDILAKKNFRRMVNLARKVLAFFDKVLATGRDKFPFETDQYLADIEAAREIVADVLAEYSGDKVERGGDGDVKLSAVRGTNKAMPENKAPGPQGDAQQGADKGNAVTDFQDRLVAAQDLAESVRSTGQRLQIRGDGYVTLYHSTSNASADSIRASGKFNGNTWFSASKSATMEHAKPKHGNKTATLEIPVDPRTIEFSTGTGEFYAPNGLTRNENGYWSNQSDQSAPVSGGAKFSAAEKQDQTQTAAFRAWFAGSKVVDSKGSPMVVYHGSPSPDAIGEFQPKNGGIYFSSDRKTAEEYTAQRGMWRGRKTGAVTEAFVALKNPLVIDAAGKRNDNIPVPWQQWKPKAFGNLPAGAVSVQAAAEYAKANGHDGLIVRNVIDTADIKDTRKSDVFVAFESSQVKSATSNSGAFDPDNADIRFSVADDIKKAIPAFDVKTAPKNSWAHYRGMAMQALGRRQIVDLYAAELPQLAQYDYLVQKMDAEKNDSGAEADKLAQDWGKLKDEKPLAELMHDATLAQIDPAKPMETGVLQAQYRELKARFDALTPEAQALYRQARDMYDGHYRKVQKAIKERIERSEMSAGQKRQIMAKMDEELFKKLKGVYFPLARFGQYVIVVKDANGEVKNVTRAETVGEAEEARKELHKAFPREMGYTVGKVLKQAEFNAGRDAVGKGFMADLMDALDAKGIDDELRDTVAQLYLSSLPDLSWAKHGIHRKGTPGFSQDARRAFAQNMFHGARYLAKLRYADQLQDELIAMQDHVKAYEGVEEYDSIQAQQVVDEMVKRHEIMMNPKSSPVSTALTSLGFVFHLGLSPASAMVNLSQTALVAYPMMGAKWGWGKASAALLAASQDVVKAKNDLGTILKGAELDAYERAVKDGTIDVTMAHDLAGISQGEDQKVFWKIRPVMRAASFMFHHAERFNRQATFIAAWRMAKEAGDAREEKPTFEELYREAKKLTYDSHYDYSAGNRPRMMQGNWQRVVFLFKQFGQNVVYTLSRNAYLSMKGLTPADRALARKNLGGILATHAAAAGVLGLPLVGPLLTAASFIGSDDDEPWDAEVAMQNVMADMVGPKAAEVMARGFSRLTPFDLSGRVALNKLILPDVQEGLEGKQWAESAMAAALGPVAGIGVNMARGFQKITEGHYMTGLEDMMPTALRAPLRAMRYASEGAVDKTGVVITDEVGPGSIAGQALGFSPSEVRRATERKAAIMDYDRSLADRRSALVRQWAEAQMAGDTDGVKDVMGEIQGFNQKNPNRKITMPHLIQSVRARRRRIEQAEDGVYLPKNREGAREAVRF